MPVQPVLFPVYKVQDREQPEDCVEPFTHGIFRDYVYASALATHKGATCKSYMALQLGEQLYLLADPKPIQLSNETSSSREQLKEEILNRLPPEHRDLLLGR